MRTTVAATLLVVVGLLTVGVGAGFGSTAHSKRTLTGGIVFTGRIPPGYAKTGYQRGVVQILRRGKIVVRAHLAQGQGYRFTLGPGKYRIRNWGDAKPPYPPVLVGVRIRAGHTTHKNIYFVFH